MCTNSVQIGLVTMWFVYEVVCVIGLVTMWVVYK